MMTKSTDEVIEPVDADSTHSDVKTFIETRDIKILDSICPTIDGLSDLDVLSLMDTIDNDEYFFQFSTTLFAYMFDSERLMNFLANQNISHTFATMCVIRSLSRPTTTNMISAIAIRCGPTFVRHLLEIPGVHVAFRLDDIFLPSIAPQFFFGRSGTKTRFSRECMRSVIRAGNLTIFRYAVHRGYELGADSLRDLVLLDDEKTVGIIALNARKAMLNMFPANNVTLEARKAVMRRLRDKNQSIYISMFLRKFPDLIDELHISPLRWLTRCCMKLQSPA